MDPDDVDLLDRLQRGLVVAERKYVQELSRLRGPLGRYGRSVVPGNPDPQAHSGADPRKQRLDLHGFPWLGSLGLNPGRLYV